MPELKEQARGHQVPGLRAELPAASPQPSQRGPGALCSCWGPLEPDGEEAWRGGQRSAPFALGACGQAAPKGSAEAVAPGLCLPAGEQPGQASRAPGEPGLQMLLRDSSIPSLRAPARLSPSLLLRLLRVSGRQPGPHSNIEHTGGPLLPWAISSRPASPRPPTLRFQQPRPRKGCPSELSPLTQTAN